MASRQLEGIARDLLDTFTSRYNDLDGYWALGQFQSYLRQHGGALVFDLKARAAAHPFEITDAYYRGALARHLSARGLSQDWISAGRFTLTSLAPERLAIDLALTRASGKSARLSRVLTIRPHHPDRELRRRTHFGPSNQAGR